MAWNTKDTALTMQGIGSLASAWGDYETNKDRNKLLSQQLQYEKDKDFKADAKMALAQTNLEDAFANSTLGKKKKKKTTTDVTAVDDSISTTLTVT